MNSINKLSILSVMAILLFTTSCKKDNPVDTFDISGTFTQADQMARPAINTVFVNSARK